MVVSKTWSAMLVAVVASTMTIAASAQKGLQTAPITPIVMPPGTDAATYRAIAISVQRLNNPALKLTFEQREEISRAIDGYVAEQMALDKSAPVAKDSKPGRAELQVRKAAIAKLATKVSNAMNDEQRRTWEADLIAHSPAARHTPKDGRTDSPGN